MGGAGSKNKISVNNPFPINDGQSKDLDLLSYVAARILSTPDIYDINNLSRPGVCGEYAVFLKKDIEKKLLPFIADVGGVPTDVVYQNPNKAITDPAVRKKICSDMADTLLRAIATVVACLASIQVASPTGSRDAAVASVMTTVPTVPTVPTVQRQIGGGTVEVRRWLHTYGYISQSDAAKPIEQKIEFRTRATVARNYTLQMLLYRTVGKFTYGRIQAEPLSGVQDPTIRAGSLNIHILDPITLPLQGQAITVLPIQITDNLDIRLLSGFLYENIFKSFKDSTPEFDIVTDYLHKIFKAQSPNKTPAAIMIGESREDNIYTAKVFKLLKETPNPQIIQQTVSNWFARKFTSGFQQPAYGQGPGQVPYGMGQGQVAYGMGLGQGQVAYGTGLGQGQRMPAFGMPAVGQPAFGMPAVGQPAIGMPAVGLANQYPVDAIALRPSKEGMEYDIPFEAGKTIGDELKRYRAIVPKESSPAAVRAKTLAGFVTERSIQTNVCNDPFWNSAKLSDIYSWATFQFLSVKDWKTFSDSKSVNFSEEWEEFIRGLSTTYNIAGLPALEKSQGVSALNQMRFSKVGDVVVGGVQCKVNRSPTVQFKEVQDGLANLNSLYNQHNAKMWAIIRDLIYVIQDPDTKSSAVRLHPNVVRSTKGETSKAYVERKRKEASRALCDFYLSVEKEYVQCVQKLQVK